MKFVEVLKIAESANGAGSKKVIQEALKTLDETGCKLMRYTMDPYTTFYVKKFDKPEQYSSTDNPNTEKFIFAVLDKLAAREITGNAARTAVSNMMAEYTKETAEYLERVIDKNPRAGFSADTFNKIWPNDKIPTWEQQLAATCEDAEDFEERIGFPCQADVKYDGNRNFAFVKKNEVKYFARGGKPSDHLNGLFDAELQEIWEAYGSDFVLDGEVMGKSFTETQNAKKGDNHAAKKSLIFRSFFIMPMSDWIAQSTTITNRQARETLQTLLEGKQTIFLTEGRIVSDYHDMMAYCDQVTDDETKTQAEREGLILKNQDAVYEWDRSFAWIKVKRFYDVDCRAVGFYEAKPKTRMEKLGLIGGINCIGFLENGDQVVFNVGSGFSFEQRRHMRENPEWWLSNVHVVKYQEVSQAKGKQYKSLRFCTYERSRDDKIVEI